MTATSELSSGAAEHTFARRIRHRMLLSYLSQQRLYPTFQSMVQQTDAHMCGDHLRRLVSGGQWAQALEYLSRFNSHKTVASNALHIFLHTLWALANVAAGVRDGSVKPKAHQHGMSLSMAISRCSKLCSIVKGMVDSPQHCASLDWNLTSIKASTIAYFLAREDPDLYRLMQLPGDGTMHPHHVLPISVSPRRRRHVNPQPRPGRRARGPAIARLYLSKRRSLLPSSSPRTPAFMDETLERVASLVDECIKAGKRQKQFQPVGRVPSFLLPLETAAGAASLQTNSGTTTSVPNAGAPASSQITSGTLTNQAKNSGVASAQISSVLQLAKIPDDVRV